MAMVGLYLALIIHSYPRYAWVLLTNSVIGPNMTVFSITMTKLVPEFLYFMNMTELDHTMNILFPNMTVLVPYTTCIVRVRASPKVYHANLNMYGTYCEERSDTNSSLYAFPLPLPGRPDRIKYLECFVL